MTREAQASLDALMARLSEGDREAFTPVFELLWPSVLRFCTQALRGHADAADAAQEAMEKILTRASDYDPERPALPWALAIASWECRTVLRKHARRREDHESRAPERATDDADPLATRQLVDAAMATLGTLSETDREALMATFWDEAASVGGATLRKRRERALTRLREAFKRLYGID